MTVLDVATCEWIGVLVDPHTHSRAFPIISQQSNMDNPKFKEEAKFVDVAKYRFGFYTKETVQKERMVSLG